MCEILAAHCLGAVACEAYRCEAVCGVRAKGIFDGRLAAAHGGRDRNDSSLAQGPAANAACAT